MTGITIRVEDQIPASGVESGSERGAVASVFRKTNHVDSRLALADARHPFCCGVPAAVVYHDDFPRRRRSGRHLARLLDRALDVLLLVVGGQDDGKG